MNTKPLLIGLSGRSGSGKSTAAAYLIKQHGYVGFAFAQPLKEWIKVTFRFSEEQLHGNLKEAIDPRYGRSPRWCMQHFGDAFREVRADFFIHHLRWRIMEFLGTNGQRPIIVTDVRFRDEAEALKSLGAVLVRIERDEAGAKNGIFGHVSETDLDGWQGFDYVIHNEADFTELSIAVENMLAVLVRPNL